MIRLLGLIAFVALCLLAIDFENSHRTSLAIPEPNISVIYENADGSRCGGVTRRACESLMALNQRIATTVLLDINLRSLALAVEPRPCFMPGSGCRRP